MKSELLRRLRCRLGFHPVAYDRFRRNGNGAVVAVVSVCPDCEAQLSEEPVESPPLPWDCVRQRGKRRR